MPASFSYLTNQGSGLRSFSHEYWKVTIHTRNWNDLDVCRIARTNFETEGQARLAVEWAYAVHLADVRSRADASDIEERPLGEGSSNPWDRKLVWRKGRHAMKDYFMACLERYSINTVTEGPTP